MVEIILIKEGVTRLYLITTCFRIRSNGDIGISNRFGFTYDFNSPDTINLGSRLSGSNKLLFEQGVIKGWLIEYGAVDPGGGVEGGGGMLARFLP